MTDFTPCPSCGLPGACKTARACAKVKTLAQAVREANAAIEGLTAAAKLLGAAVDDIMLAYIPTAPKP